MADIQRGHTFTDGSSGNVSADLHELVDDATILPEFITGKGAVITLEDTDLFVVYDNSATALKKQTFANLKASFPKDDTADTYSLRRLGTTSQKAAAGNDTRFPASVTGIRVGAGAGSNDIAATGKDFRHPVDLSGEDDDTVIDWDIGNVFYDELSANRTFTFANKRIGRSIQIVIKLNGHTPTWPVDIGTVVVGTGTTFLHLFLTYTAEGTTGLQIAI
jgi:hypothetical protein